MQGNKIDLPYYTTTPKAVKNFALTKNYEELLLQAKFLHNSVVALFVGSLEIL